MFDVQSGCRHRTQNGMKKINSIVAFELKVSVSSSFFFLWCILVKICMFACFLDVL